MTFTIITAAIRTCFGTFGFWIALSIFAAIARTGFGTFVLLIAFAVFIAIAGTGFGTFVLLVAFAVGAVIWALRRTCVILFAILKFSFAAIIAGFTITLL